MIQNKKSAKRIVITLAVISVFAVAVCSNIVFDSINAFAAATDSQKQIHELETKLSTLAKETAALKKQIASSKSTIASLETEIANLDSETTLLSSQITTMDTLLEQWQVLSDEKEAQIKELEQKQKEQQKTFDNMLRMSYEYGSDTYFNLIFGSEDIGDFLSRIDLITYHLKYNSNVLDSLSGTIKDLEKTKSEYQDSQTSLSDYKQTQEELKTELEVKISQATVKKQTLMNETASAQAMYNKKEAERAQIDAEVKALYEKSGNTKNNFTGSFAYPLPANYTYVSSGFVNRISPITGKRENHNGLDLPAPYGTKIYAAEAGTVVIAKRSSSWGNYVTIDHGGGMMTLYAHASSLNVTAGQTVKRGDVIAFVGSTGWSTGNHLHFTVYKNGVAVDPRPYIPYV